MNLEITLNQEAETFGEQLGISQTRFTELMDDLAMLSGPTSKVSMAQMVEIQSKVCRSPSELAFVCICIGSLFHPHSDEDQIIINLN